MSNRWFRLKVWKIVGVFLFVNVAGLSIQTALAQDSLDVLFRYVPPEGTTVQRVYLPGSFNNWGPNASGQIAVNAVSRMTYVDSLGQWTYVKRLRVGSSYQYKIHYHTNAGGTEYVWLPDPLNPNVALPDNNSVLNVTALMLFQPGVEFDTEGNIRAISAGIFSVTPVSSVHLTVNGQEVDTNRAYDSASGLFRYIPEEPIAEGLTYALEVVTQDGKTASHEAYIPLNVRPEDEPRPAGLEDGITYDPADPTQVTLSLFAPHKAFVYVIGDFTNWQIDPGYLMKRDSLKADSVWHWITLDGLTPGQEYGFQYLVDGTLRIADPYAHKLLTPDDVNIPASTYPGLKPYPTGKTSEYVAVLQTGQEPYSWEISDFQRPDQKDLVIYELLVRDFIGKRNYQTLADTLDYLKRLGVNAIELMPISEFDGNLSWGYNPAFHLAPDKYYGTPENLKRFIDAAHEKGMAVILDVVYNHATGLSPLVRLYNDAGYGPPSAQNPWANMTARHPFNVFNDLNHESKATQYWLDRANKYWLTEFNVDGYRFDLSKGFTQRFTGDNVSAWGAYDASRVRLLKRMADRIWAVDSTAYVILEHFADNTEEKELAAYRTAEGYPGMMLWGNMNAAYNEATMGYASNLTTGFYAARGWTVPNLVTYMESHDEERLMVKNLAFGACENYPAGGSGCATDPGDYSTRKLNVALDREKLAGAFFFTLSGPKMIWQFGELGYDVSIDFNGRTGEKPIRWNYLNDPLRLKLYKTWQALLTLRNENEVFTSTETAVTQDVAGTVKTISLVHPSMNVFVVGNFGVNATAVRKTFPSTGRWYRYFEGDSVDVAGALDIELLPSQFFIYTTKKQEIPESGLITVDVEDDGSGEVPATYTLEQNYPNPFNPVTTIEYGLAASGDVRLEVFDVLGRRVAVLADGVEPAGLHRVIFDASRLASGTYVYRLHAGPRVLSRTLVVLK